MEETRLELRRAEATDAAAIRDLTRSAYAKWVPLIGREPKPMSADYDAAVQAHRFDLLLANGVLAALIETIAEPDHLLVENVAVSPDFQGRGFGRRLMAHAEALALAAGYGEIRLYTNQRFAENVALYRKLGYRVDREEDVGVGIAVQMSKRLQEAG
ncbi:GNAT family N-acetyltransferase [Reyranella sp.]|uniref:GNAT family N-acetyltransferase n=1 Tax=Reyranella sp. TaxID=1929291 RepID=UPI003BAA3022